jgi:hypothetical protein
MGKMNDIFKSYLKSESRKTVYFIKKLPEGIGLLFIAFVFFGSLFIVLRTIYYDVWYPIILLVGCIFMALPLRKGGLYFPSLVLILFCIFCVVCISANSRNGIYLKSVLLRGEKKSYKVYIQGTTEDGVDYPAHYDTRYEFKPDASESAFNIGLVNSLLVICPLGCCVTVFLMLRKNLKD